MLALFSKSKFSSGKPQVRRPFGNNSSYDTKEKPARAVVPEWARQIKKGGYTYRKFPLVARRKQDFKKFDIWERLYRIRWRNPFLEIKYFLRKKEKRLAIIEG